MASVSSEKNRTKQKISQDKDEEQEAVFRAAEIDTWKLGTNGFFSQFHSPIDL